MTIKCPKELNQFLLDKPVFENVFPEEECEMRKFYGDCYHCFASSIARRDKALKESRKLLTTEDVCKEFGLSDIGEFSDGYHTFNSLYHQRAVLFAAIVNMNPDVSFKSKKHADGKKCFDSDNWFIVGVETPEGNYTYHYEMKYWDMFKCEEVDRAPEWDGHTDADVERVLSLRGY